MEFEFEFEFAAFVVFGVNTEVVRSFARELLETIWGDGEEEAIAVNGKLEEVGEGAGEKFPLELLGFSAEFRLFLAGQAV